MRRTFCVALVTALCVNAVVMVHARSETAVRADEPKPDKAAEPKSADPVSEFKKSIADSKLPEELKKMPEKTTFGKVYAVWPMSDGTVYFALSTAKGPVWFTFKTGAVSKAEHHDQMVKALMFAQEKQFMVGAYSQDATHVTGGIIVVSH
jgi:hypothetical protein